MATMQQSLRKAYGALKDSTTVGLANLNSDFKELDVAIVKSTNHVERPPKERHLRKIFAATSITRPGADVAYCLNALSRRLAKTHNWTELHNCAHNVEDRCYTHALISLAIMLVETMVDMFVVGNPKPKRAT